MKMIALSIVNITAGQLIHRGGAEQEEATQREGELFLPLSASSLLTLRLRGEWALSIEAPMRPLE